MLMMVVAYLEFTVLEYVLELYLRHWDLLLEVYKFRMDVFLSDEWLLPFTRAIRLCVVWDFPPFKSSSVSENM